MCVCVCVVALVYKSVIVHSVYGKCANTETVGLLQSGKESSVDHLPGTPMC